MSIVTATQLADVTSAGAILLGPHVCCDGFFYGAKARVQSHVHVDHMRDFDSSKGQQDIVLSKPTKALIEVARNADIPYRSNIRAVALDEAFEVADSKVTLRSSGHMLGSVQVEVQMSDGRRAGYSGDFQWPLTQPIQVDALVVDSTYGSPRSVRRYTQEHACERLREIVDRELIQGSVVLVAHRGTMQRAMEVLAERVNVPCVADRTVCRELEVYAAHGFSIRSVLDVCSPEGLLAKNERHIRICYPGDMRRLDTENYRQVGLSAYWTSPDDPVLEISESSVRIALSDHADFDGTLEYVRSTGAREVITDNSRGGHAVELAIELQQRLGITARPSVAGGSREWGK